MRDSRLLLTASIFLAIYGAANLIYALTIWTMLGSMIQTNLTGNQDTFFLVTYLFIQGLIPLVAGVLGIFWHNKLERTKIIYYYSWLLMAVYYYLFFTSYGQGWMTVLYDLGCVIVALVYFHAARTNLDEAKAFYENIKKRETDE